MEDVAGRKGRTLTPEENRRVRQGLEKLLEKHTQREVAEMLGFSQSTISAVLAKRSGGSVFLGIAIANALGVHPSTIVNLSIAEPGPQSAVAEVPASEFLAWFYATIGIPEMVNRHADVTLQDLVRLRALPAPHGATAKEIYRHVVKLRTAAPDGTDPPGGSAPAHEPVDPDDVLKDPPTPGERKRRRPTRR